MELDLTWVLLGLPLAFVGGWLASRFDIRQWRMENRSAPKSYFRGLNFLLNEQQDEAIDAFIEAVQQDPDTTELHFALGNLFRSRGDYDRAVRVHQHLLQRADLSRADHERAQHALSLDFTRAGLLDRAEASLRLLLGTPYESEAQVTLLALYERTSDWAHAIEVARQLESANRGSFKSRMAHYHCELAADATQKNQPIEARTHLEQALAICPESARARLALAQWLEDRSAPNEACAQLEALAQHSPGALPLAAMRLAKLSARVGRQAQAQVCLSQAQAQRPSLDYVEALASLLPADDLAAQSALCLDHLRQEPSLVVATRWLDLQSASQPGQALPAEVTQALQKATTPLKRYRCAACGFEAGIHFWQCPGCQTWDSYSPRRVDDL
ncbi:MAG: lipopolysaccharide assembly protein LapB [Polaromonas sp.]|nr:lipopolysaccharide assembly protein LapB [Polaromonas sp.]